MPKSQKEQIILSLHKGRESALNLAIVELLLAKEPQTTHQLFNKIRQMEEFKHTSYSAVNKRIRRLEKMGYLQKVLVKKRAGGYTNYYQLRPKVYLAKFLAANSIYKLLEQVDDQTAQAILKTLIQAKNQETKPKKSKTSNKKIDKEKPKQKNAL